VLVTDPVDVAAIAERIARSPLAAFDVEFVSQDRLVPTLCLVQVAWHSSAAPESETVPEVRLLDALAVDVGPVVAALAAHGTVVAHAARQDLGLFAQRFGAALPGLVDTQLMAAFLGIGDQVGLAALAADVLGVALAKEQQWTDWARRPLSDAQLSYAAADVRYLPAIYARLAARLGPRLAWVREESRSVGADATAAAGVTAETAWQQVGGARGLDPQGRAALRALAAWRHRVATEMDRPLGQVLNDKVLVELAKDRPRNPGGVRGVKGASPIAKSRADQILGVLADALAAEVIASEPAPPRGGRGPASTRAQRWAEMMLAIVQLVAEQTHIAPRLLATRADAEEAARIVDEHGVAAAAKLPAFSTWRRAVIGDSWEGWLTGRLAIVGDPAAPQGLRLVATRSEHPAAAELGE
jgi:ribonuclease D